MRGETFRQLRTAEVRQDHVREQQIQRRIAMHAELEAGQSVAGHQHSVTLRAQRVADHFAKRSFILDEQYQLRMPHTATSSPTGRTVRVMVACERGK